MFVLVTGGAGFIGSHSVDALLAQGAKVRVLDDLSSGSRDNLRHVADRIEFIEGDIRDAACVARSMQDITHVLHLAALVSVPASIAAPVHSHSINSLGFINVMDAARTAGVVRMVYASSAAVYGVPAHLPLTDASPVAPMSPYGLEKLVNDQYATLYRDLYGLSSLGLRFFNVYGPRQDPTSSYSGVISKFADWAMRGLPFSVYGDGLQTRDFICVTDIARANVAALLSEARGVVNLATGHSVTMLELARTFEAIAGRPVEVRHLPARTGDIVHSSVTPQRMRDELMVRDTVPLATGLRQLLAHLGAAIP